MTLITRQLKEDVTHWPINGTDGYGGFTFATPIKLKGRWEDKAVLFLDANNEEHVSESIVFISADVVVGDYLGRGDLTDTADPTTISGPRRIRQRQKTTDLRNLQSIRKAFL